MPFSALPVSMPAIGRCTASATCRATFSLSPVMILSCTPRCARSTMAFSTSALGGSKKSRKPVKVRPVSSAREYDAARPSIVLGGHAQHAEALAAPVAVALFDPGQRLVVQRLAFRRRPARCVQMRQDILQRALGDQGALPCRVRPSPRSALAHEVVRDLIDLSVPRRCLQPGLLGVGADGIVQRIVRYRSETVR